MTRQALSTRARPGLRRAADRRRTARVVPPQEIVCYWSCGGEYARARVYDLSASGLCVLVSQRLEVGAELIVELINGAHTFLCARGLRVVRVFQGSGKGTVIGGVFDRKLGYGELLPFLL
jgi:hypothetical protein